MGTLALAIPRVRDGSYFPSLLEPRGHAERALLAVVQEAYVLGVSTRRVEDLVEALGIASLSRSEVSRMCSAWMPRSRPSAAARRDVLDGDLINRPVVTRWQCLAASPTPTQ